MINKATEVRKPKPDQKIASESSQAIDFRLFLQGELVARCKKNSRYSVRSFARTLGLDSSTLSQILRGKRKLTRKGIARLASRLGLGPEETTRFQIINQGTEVGTPSLQELKIDTFHIIADWYHYAIFELITVKDFQADAKWIAKRLGISVPEAHAAVERLQRLELIEENGDGSWKQGSSLITTTGNPFTNAALKKHQAQILEMSLSALEEVPIEMRDHTGMVMAIHSKRIPEAKERIKKFRRELCEYLQQDKERDSVYQLGVSFYPLTKMKEEGK